MAPKASADIALPRVILTKAINGERCADLLKRSAYYRCTQYKGRSYFFDGTQARWGDDGGVQSEHYVPMRQRQPSLRMDLPRIIVDRLTSLVFGHDRFPLLKVEGDHEAEEYLRELSKAAKLPTKMFEARNLGGAAGAVAVAGG